MSISSPVLEESRENSGGSGPERRAWPRHACGIDTACQPIAARGDNDMSWSAQIDNVSVGGLGLILQRRFERGTGLAIEIPATDAVPADTLLAKVVHVTPQPDGRWLLGCAFVSALSEDEVHRLVAIGQGQICGPRNTRVYELTQLDGPPPAPRQVFQDVTWIGSIAGKRVERLVRRVHFAGTWPLAEGIVLTIWFGRHPQAKARLRINSCRQQAGRWVVDYTFLEPVPPEVLRAFSSQRSALSRPLTAES